MLNVFKKKSAAAADGKAEPVSRAVTRTILSDGASLIGYGTLGALIVMALFVGYYLFATGALDIAAAKYHDIRGRGSSGDESVAHHSEAIRLRPNSAKYRYGRGIAYANRHPGFFSHIDYDMVCANGSYDMVGICMKWRSSVDSALIDIGTAIERDVGNAEYHFAKGLVYHYLKKDRDSARAYYSEAARLKPRNKEYREGLERFHEKHPDPDSAVVELNRCLQAECGIERERRDWDVAWNNFLMSNVRLAQGDTAAAFTDIAEAIRLDPRTLSYRILRGNLYAARGDYDSAAIDLFEALRINPETLYRKSLREGDHDGIIRRMSEKIERDPKDAYSYDNRGLAYFAMNEYEKAVADFDEAILLASESVENGGNFRIWEFFANRGIAHFRKEEYGLAIADFSEALAVIEADTLRLFKIHTSEIVGIAAMRGGAHFFNGDYDSAIADFNSFYKPDMPQVGMGASKLALEIIYGRGIRERPAPPITEKE